MKIFQKLTKPKKRTMKSTLIILSKMLMLLLLSWNLTSSLLKYHSRGLLRSMAITAQGSSLPLSHSSLRLFAKTLFCSLRMKITQSPFLSLLKVSVLMYQSMLRKKNTTSMCWCMSNSIDRKSCFSTVVTTQ